MLADNTAFSCIQQKNNPKMALVSQQTGRVLIKKNLIISSTNPKKN